MFANVKFNYDESPFRCAFDKASGNTQNEELFKMLQKMEASQYRFFLTGSQYFCNATEKSDYDFFTAYGEAYVGGALQQEKWLEKNGFQWISQNYFDSTIYKIYRKLIGSTHIDIQILHNTASVYTKNAVQKHIKGSMALQMAIYRLDKTERGMLWDSLIELFISGAGEKVSIDPIMEIRL